MGLVDDVTGTITHGYSVARYIRTAFTGAVCRLHETTGGTEQDFKIVAGALVTDDVNEDSVATWLTDAGASAPAVIADIYDQVGSLTLSQATEANMPQLDEAYVNSKPGADATDTTTTWLETANYDPETGSGNTIIGVFKNIETTNLSNMGVVTNNATTLLGLFSSHLSGTGNKTYRYLHEFGFDASTPTFTDDNARVISGVTPTGGGSVSCFIREDGTLEDTSGASVADGRNRPLVVFAASTGGGTPFGGGSPEFIITENELSASDISIVECDMGDFYAVTVAGCSVPTPDPFIGTQFLQTLGVGT